MSISLLRVDTSTTIAGPKNASSDNSCEPDHPSRTWSGASAWVPTCGLEVKDDTLTLAPAAIDEAQPHVNGVSPGHSGVSGLSVTLISRSRGSRSFAITTFSGSSIHRTGFRDYLVPTSFFAVSAILSAVIPRWE